MERFLNPKLQLDFMLNVFFHKYQTFHYKKMKENDKMVCQMPVGGGKGPIFMTRILDDSCSKSSGNIDVIASHRRILNYQHFTDLLKLMTPLAGETIYINNSSMTFPNDLAEYFGKKTFNKLDILCFSLQRNYVEYSNCDFNDYKTLKKILKEQRYYPVDYTEEELNEFLTYKIYKNNLSKGKRPINFSSTIYNTTNPLKIREIIEAHKDKNIVIISTYDSLGSLGKIEKGLTKMPTGKKYYQYSLDPLDINVIYCDEAHELATEETVMTEDDKEAFFKKNYKSLKCRHSYFFSATPKESDDNNTTSFLMNNPRYYGPTETTSFRECVDIGQIISPYLHKIKPRSFEDFETNITNRSYFVIDGFLEHRKDLINFSCNPKIGAKDLVKCKNIKDDAKGIYDYLKENICSILDSYTNLDMDRIFICVGGMYNEGKFDEIGNYIKGSNKQRQIYKMSEFILSAAGMWVLKQERDFNKIKYIDEIKDKGIDVNMIVLHFDTLSEGINVNGFTAVTFISGNILSETKIIQNLGRASRLTKNDRYNLKNGIISLKDKKVKEVTVVNKTWEKPFFAVKVPWSDDDNDAMNKIVSIYQKLKELLGRVRVVSSVIGNPEGNQKREVRNRNWASTEDECFDTEFEHTIDLKIKNIEEKKFIQKQEEDLIAKVKQEEDNKLNILKMAAEEDKEEYEDYYYLGEDEEKLTEIEWLKRKYNLE